jgi:hypothetical protein
MQLDWYAVNSRLRHHAPNVSASHVPSDPVALQPGNAQDLHEKSDARLARVVAMHDKVKKFSWTVTQRITGDRFSALTSVRLSREGSRRR